MVVFQPSRFTLFSLALPPRNEKNCLRILKNNIERMKWRIHELTTVVLWIGLVVTNSSMYALPSSQISALNDLYEAMNGSYWQWVQPYHIYGYPWNFSQSNINPCLKWQGILCTSNCSFTSCSVTFLTLENMGLYGKLPDTIVNFPNLEVMYLSGNNIYGPIPSNIGKLQNLVELVLEYNMMDGSIPLSIGSCSLLSYLFINNNQLTGEIPSTIALMSNLAVFVGNDNFLDGTIPLSIGKLPQLNYFGIHQNMLVGTVPDSFQNPFLQTLDVASNELTGTLPASLFTLQYIYQVSFHGNQLNGILPSNFYPASTLIWIDVYSNYLTSTIPQSWTTLQGMINIDVHQNILSSSIPVGFSNMLNVTELLFDQNCFTGSIPSWTNLPMITYIDLSSNLLNGTIPDTIGSLTSLANLWIANNFFTGTLPRSLLNLRNLQALVVANNSLGGTIPSDIDRLESLVTFQVLLNYFSGPIPVRMGYMTNLSVIDCKGNQFNGTIPEDLGNLWNLQYLYLSFNELTGTIPASLGNLANLVEIWINSNLMHGTVPKELGRLHRLQNLWLYGNSFHGTLPKEFSEMIDLKDFEIDRNFFSGTFPEDYGLLTNLSVFVANMNIFNGSIPDSFGNLQFLINLILNDNQMTGSIPYSLRFLCNVQYLSLYQNLFTGTVPDIFGNMTHLSSLWLYNNFFHGTLPPTLSYATSMKLLYLQQNILSGTLSSALNSWEVIEYAMFYSNRFSGTLPPYFEHWPLLQYFSVYNNLFTGTIPSSLNNNSVDQITMNFDRNYFSGSIGESLILSGKIIFFSASLNCLSGSLSSAWCNNLYLTTLVLDGIHASPHCSRPVFPAYPNSAYLVSGSFGGTIPSCLLNLPTLQTLHLSGNNLDGTLPDLSTVGSHSLQNLVVSHNSLVGTIPTSIWSYPFVSLDLSFNRLTGTVPNNDEVFNYSDISTSLAVQVNRLSGVLPAVWEEAPNINILEGNMFSCESTFSATTQHLPLNDENAARYQCGSLYTNYSLLGAVILAVSLASGVVIFIGLSSTQQLCCDSSFGRWANHVHEQFRASLHFIDTLTDSNKAWLQIRYWVQDMKEFLRLLCLLVGMIWLIGVPLYVSFSKSYGTYTLQYAWTLSLTYISGTLPAFVLWIFLLCLLEVLLLYAQWFRPALWREHFLAPEHLYLVLCNSVNYQKHRLHFANQSTSESNNSSQAELSNPIHADDEEKTAGSEPSSEISSQTASESSEKKPLLPLHFRHWIIRSMAVLINVAIVLTVNAAYIIAIETQPDFVAFTFISITVSLFKVFWNNSIICNNALGQYVMHSLANHESGSNSNLILFNADVQVMLVVSNNILAPLIAAQLVSSSCFEYAVTRPPEVTLSIPSGQCYFYEYNIATGVQQNFTCLAINVLEADLGQTVSVLDTVSTGDGGQVKFFPGFSYSFQCSSSLLQAFMYIFVMRFIFSAMILPSLLAVLKIVQQSLFLSIIQRHRESFLQGKVVEPMSALGSSPMFRISTMLLPPLLRVVSLPAIFENSDVWDASQIAAVSIWLATNVDILHPLIPQNRLLEHSSLPKLDPALLSGVLGSIGMDSVDESDLQRSSEGSKSGAAPLYLAKTLRVRVISDFAVLLSFAVLFPPLSLLILLAIGVDVFVTVLSLGRMMHLYESLRSWSPLIQSPKQQAAYESCMNCFLAVINLCDRKFHSFYGKLWRGIATVCYLAALLWAFALYDVYGNVQGAVQSVWFLLVTCFAPAWLSLTVNQVITGLIFCGTRNKNQRNSYAVGNGENTVHSNRPFSTSSDDSRQTSEVELSAAYKASRPASTMVSGSGR